MPLVMLQETGRVVKHIESWDVEPGKVVQQLLKPASSMPESQTERFMLALSKRDVKGMWLSSADVALLSAAPLVAVAVLVRSITGHGLPVRPSYWSIDDYKFVLWVCRAIKLAH